MLWMLEEFTFGAGGIAALGHDNFEVTWNEEVLDLACLRASNRASRKTQKTVATQVTEEWGGLTRLYSSGPIFKRLSKPENLMQDMSTVAIINQSREAMDHERRFWKRYRLSHRC